MTAAKKSGSKDEIRVSLLPDDESSIKGVALVRLYTLFGVFVLLIAAIAGSSWYLQFQAGRMLAEAQARRSAVREVSTQIQQAEAEFSKVRNIGGIIGFAKSMLLKHTAAENIFKTLELAVIPEVELKNIAADGKGVIILAGRAKDFSAIARQIRVWKEYDGVQDMKVSGIQTAVGAQGKVDGIDFNATLTLVPAVLAWKP